TSPLMRKYLLFGCLVVALVALAYHRRGGSPQEIPPEPWSVGGQAITLGARADSLRDEIARTLRLASAANTDSARLRLLRTAHTLARAYAAAWSDSFLLRRVARFETASPARRRAWAAADSFWRAGRAAIGQQGVPAAMALWRESLRLASTTGDSAGRAAAVGAIGAGFYSAGDLDSATRYLTEAQHLARAVGDFRSLGNALGNLASVSKDRGDLARAAQQYQEALAIRSRSGDTRGMAADQNNLGLVAWSLGDLDQARRAFEHALELNQVPGRERQAALNRSNLGDLASIEGDYAAAQASYEEALALNRSTGDLAETAFVLHDLGLLASRRGDYPTAMTALSEALAVHQRSGAVLEAVSVRGDLARVQAATGDLQSAVATLRRAEADASGADAPRSVEAGLALSHADLALQFGRWAEADAEYARAERLYRESGGEAGAAEARQGRGLLLLLGDDHAGALRLLDLAARGQARAGDRRAAALTRLLTGDTQREMGDTTVARRTLTAALDSLMALGDTTGEVAALVTLAELAEQRGAPLEAESLYQRGLDRLGSRSVSDLRWRLHAGLGRSLRGRGALADAAEQLRTAIASIERVATGLSLEERRAGFLSDKWQVYATLALVEQARGRAAEAFAVSERMRGRQMLAMLARGRVAPRTEAGAREQDLRRRISELTAEIEGTGPHQGSRREPVPGSHSLEVAREALDATQKTYARLLLEMRESDPHYARLVAPEPADWRATARRLKPDAILLEYLVTDSASTVLAVTADTVAAIDLDIGRQELVNLIEFSRGAMGRPDGPAAGQLWRTPLRRLYQQLIEPVERAGYLDGKRALVLVPHADLHFLPFGALLGPEQFLVERFEIGYAPSASVWLQLRERPALRRSDRILALAPHADRLPASGEEVASIQDVYGRRATILAGSAASERALRSGASRYDVLHLATLGVLNKHNPLFSYVKLADEDDDDRLEVHEVFALDLEGQLVVLSACQTALASGAMADVPAGDDWVGLTQAFLQAGAGGVLASLWRVEDRATGRLMQLFYRRLAAGEPVAAALAAAQRALLHEPGKGHPFYWAGFVLSGSNLN
ncbi:MAG: CHAT domain-containing protein, partial [Gemmatimonadales bacterium]